MKIIQLIDSLDSGGAERMAVNYANALVDEIGFSALVATRKEGVLKNELNPSVCYQYLNRKGIIDLNAILRLRDFCKTHSISIVHAHGSSFFTALLLKFIHYKIRIVWHDHNGDRNSQSRWSNKILWISSNFFAGIIVVNHRIEEWINSKMACGNVIYLPNFTQFSVFQNVLTKLKGSSGKRILHLANLRDPKNHQLVLDVAVLTKETYPKWTFHFVGKDLDDEYSRNLKVFIKESGLQETVYIYGSKTDTGNIISQCDIGVLSSDYEGLPVSLLEYGMYSKAVVATDVGEIPLLIDNGSNGYICPAGNAEKFYESLSALIANPDLRLEFGKRLALTVGEHNSKQVVIAQYIKWLEDLKA